MKKMKLKEYLDTRGMTYTFFTRMLGMHYKTLHQIIIGNRTPDLEHALMIEKATDGFVKCRDLLKTDVKLKALEKKIKNKT